MKLNLIFSSVKSDYFEIPILAYIQGDFSTIHPVRNGKRTTKKFYFDDQIFVSTQTYLIKTN